MKKFIHLVCVFLISNIGHAQFTEGFESGTFPPTGWTSYRGTNNVGINNDWELSSIVANTGNNSAFVKWENSGSLNEDWLVTNQIDLSTVVNSELRFFARQDFLADYGSIYSVRVSQTSQTTDFTTVKSWTELQLTTISDSFEEKTVDLSNFDGESIYIAFVMENDNGDSWWIDDISIVSATGCDAPTSAVSSITNTSASLSWGDVTTASLGYEWVIMNSGDDPVTGTPVDSGTTSSGVTVDTTASLSPSITYDFYVRANCDTLGLSDWSTVFSFLTPPVNDNLCDAIALTLNSPSSNGAYTNVGSGREFQEPDGTCWDNLSDNTVWFKFNAPPSGEVNITTNFSSGSLLDTQISLYSVGDCNDMSTLSELFCNEDIDFINDNFLSEIEATGLINGYIYYIQVDGYSNNIGTFDIEVTGYLPPNVLINPIVILQGAMLNPNTGEETLMRDDLRVLGYIPTTSPYADALTCDASVFNANGSDAILDWVLVELRDENDNTTIIHSQSALLQRDGDVVDVDGVSALRLYAAAGNYYVSIKHRNHLGVMSANAIALSGTSTVVNFSDGSVPTFGTNAQTSFGMPAGVSAMHAGDADNNGNISFANDGNQVLFDVLLHPNNVTFSSSYTLATGYYTSDINLNGTVSFQNDLNTILTHVLLYPANTTFNSSYSLFDEQVPSSASSKLARDAKFEANQNYIQTKINEVQE